MSRTLQWKILNTGTCKEYISYVYLIALKMKLIRKTTTLCYSQNTRIANAESELHVIHTLEWVKKLTMIIILLCTTIQEQLVNFYLSQFAKYTPNKKRQKFDQ